MAVKKPAKTSGNGKAKGGRPAAAASVESRIKARYPELPESERRIADLILEFPGEMAAYSATELAALSGGSKAAVTRLVQRIGFANYDEARRAARDAQSWGSPLYLMARETEKTGFSARVRQHIETDAHNIALTLETLRGDAFNDMVAAICKARRVFLLGYRNSHYLAGYARWQIIQGRGDVYLLPAAGETIAEELADLTAEDVLIVIGFRRRVAQVPQAMAVAAQTGTRILYITDRAAPASPHATWTIPCAVRGMDMFDRYAAAMSLLHFLCVAIVEKLGGPGRARLQHIETLHEELHDFD
ncbi:MAG: MurR/RpiR family transcriptional regulator [Kiloniellaceae bacterium]